MTAEPERPAPAAPARLPLDHYGARERWGVPDQVEGNVNDPRTREEHGIRFNEKWIYLLSEGRRRLIYWHRYDCRGIVIEEPDGSATPESL